MVDQTLREHEHMIDEHDIRLETLQSDVNTIKSDLNNVGTNINDVKVRLGIKDKTNGQVLEYYKQLIDAQEKEREDRKEQDRLLFERLDKVDERIWYLVVGIGISVLLEIGVFIIQSHL